MLESSSSPPECPSEALAEGKSMSSPSHHWIVTAISDYQRHSEGGLGHMGSNNGIPAPKGRGKLSLHFLVSMHTTSTWDIFGSKAVLWPPRGRDYDPACFSAQQTRTFSPEIRWLPAWGQIPRKTLAPLRLWCCDGVRQSFIGVRTCVSEHFTTEI